MPAIFLHGLESSDQGTKARFFRQNFPDMLVPNFQGSLSGRMERLQNIVKYQDNLTIIGSSFGGLMASLFALRNEKLVNRLILLAPALNFPEFVNSSKKRLSIPAWLYIGKRDLITPVHKVAPIAREIFETLYLYEFDDDHLLHKTFATIDWNKLIR